MNKEHKNFDCVEMKRQNQENLLREYEERRNEFDSYLAFIHAKAEESEWVRKQRQRMNAA